MGHTLYGDLSNSLYKSGSKFLMNNERSFKDLAQCVLRRHAFLNSTDNNGDRALDSTGQWTGDVLSTTQ